MLQQDGRPYHERSQDAQEMWYSFQSSGRLGALVEEWNFQAFSAQNIAKLVNLAREYNWIDFLNVDLVTDLDIAYSLLEKAFPSYAEAKIKDILFASSADFYDEAEDICLQYLADWLERWTYRGSCEPFTFRYCLLPNHHRERA